MRSVDDHEQELIRAAEALGQAKEQKEQVVEKVAQRVEFSNRWGSWRAAR